MSTDNVVTDPKTVVIRYVEAVRDGDLALIRDSFAEDASWTYLGEVPLLGRVWQGRDTIVDEFLGGAGALFAPGTGAEVALVNAFADGEQVLAEWTSKATARNGAAYDNRCAGIFTVREGRIVSVREYADTLHVVRSLFPDQA